MELKREYEMNQWRGWIVGGVIGGVIGLGIPTLAFAADSWDTLRYAVSGGTPNLDMRLRYESVDQGDGVPTAPKLDKATADTIRTRLGYTTGKWNDLDVQVEMEDVSTLNKQDYNSCPAGVSPSFGKCNGHTKFSVIADPTGTELNQVWLRYSGLPKTVIKYGRQRIILDNARFIGNAGWRQNEMTYDGVSLVNTYLPKTTITYAHLNNVDNIYFGDFNLVGDLLNVAWAPSEMLTLVGYDYLLDFDKNLAARRDTQTLGLRATGSIPFGGAYKFIYSAEYADQKHYKDSPSDVSAKYYLVEAGAVAYGVTGKLGYEVLGGDGNFGFQTPLATLHAFQGWADQFLATPKTGIRDAYICVGAAPFLGINLLGVYHDYKADEGGNHYGKEWNAQAIKPINDNLSVQLKYADFTADEAASGITLRDTKKLWVEADYKF